jgi:hypothetical protein
MQQSPSRTKLLPWLTLAAIVGTFAVNVWSNIAPLNGESIGQISNRLFADVKIIPANYAFAIWGLIYLGLLAFGVYQLRLPQSQEQRLQTIRLPLIVACVAQAIWVFFFLSRQFWLSVVAMLAILLPLILLYLRLEVGLRPVARSEKWLVQVPFGIYLGWISVATIVNIALALYSQGWNGWGIPDVWTVLMMLAAAAIAATLTVKRREFAYPLVIAWALLAIAVRQATVPLVFGAAIVLAVLLTALVLMKAATRPNSSKV